MAHERRVNLRFPIERFDQLDEKRFKMRTTFQEIGSRLFEEWLTGERSVALPPPTKTDPLLEKFEMVRASGDAQLLAIVRKAVEASYGLLQHSLSAEEIERLRAATNSYTGMAGKHRGAGVSGDGEPGVSKTGTRKSA